MKAYRDMLRQLEWVDATPEDQSALSPMQRKWRGAFIKTLWQGGHARPFTFGKMAVR